MSSTVMRFVIVLAALASLSSIGSLAAIDDGGSKAVVAQANSDEVPRITPDQVRELLKNGKAVLVDVRGEAAYKAGHIKGALLIPAAEIGERGKELPRDKMIAAYCS